MAIIIATLGMFSFKSAEVSQEKMVSLANYKVDKVKFDAAMCNISNPKSDIALKYPTGKVLKVVGYALVALGEWLSPIIAPSGGGELPESVVNGLEQEKILIKL